MNKPITLIYEEFRRNLTDLINKSGLPAFIIENVLASYIREVNISAKKQYEADKSVYEHYITSTMNKDGEDSVEHI